MRVALPIPRDSFASFSGFFRELKKTGYNLSDERYPRLLEDVYFVFEDGKFDENGKPMAEVVRGADLKHRFGIDPVNEAKPATGWNALLTWEYLLRALGEGFPLVVDIRQVLLDMERRV